MYQPSQVCASGESTVDCFCQCSPSSDVASAVCQVLPSKAEYKFNRPTTEGFSTSWNASRASTGSARSSKRQDTEESPPAVCGKVNSAYRPHPVRNTQRAAANRQTECLPRHGGAGGVPSGSTGDPERALPKKLRGIWAPQVQSPAEPQRRQEN